MEKKIAVLFDEQNQITDFLSVHHITVYEKKNTWMEIKTLSDLRISAGSGGSVRAALDNAVGRLEDCKVIVGSLIVGIPYYILDKNGFIVCEAQQFSEELLEQICTDYLEEVPEVREEEQVNIPKKPVPVDNEGNYFFDFASVQKAYPEISSKKALLPFFSNELFQSITIICTHIMPWLDTYIVERNLKMESNRESGLTTLIISHKSCKDGEE